MTNHMIYLTIQVTTLRRTSQNLTMQFLSSLYSVFIQQGFLIIPYNRGSQIPVARSQWRSNFQDGACVLLLVLSCFGCNCCWLAVCIIVVILCVFVVLCVHCYSLLQRPDCWLEVSTRKVLQPAISIQVFLGFPVSISKR